MLNMVRTLSALFVEKPTFPCFVFVRRYQDVSKTRLNAYKTKSDQKSNIDSENGSKDARYIFVHGHFHFPASNISFLADST